MDQARIQSSIERFAQLRLVVDHPAAGAGKRVGWAHDERIAGSAGEGEAFVDHGDDRTFGDGLADLEHFEFEALAVFGESNRLDGRAEHLDVITRQYAGFVEFDGEIQTGLTAQRGKERIGPFAGDDLFNRSNRQRLQIDGIRDLGIRHDRRRIGVDEDDAMAFLAECPARLNAGVIKLCGLADDDRPRPDDHNVPARH